MKNGTHIRADPDFKEWLKKMKVKRAKNNIKSEIESDRKLSKRILSCNSIKLLERELTVDKRGALTDLFVWIIIGMILLVFLGVWVYAHNLLTTELLEAAAQNQNNINFTAAAQDTFGQINSGLGVFSWATGAIIFALGLSILISNFLVKVNPVFLIPYFLVVVLAIVFSVFLSNAYETALAGNELIGSTLTSFGGANFIFMNLPIWVAIIGFLGGIIMFIGIIRDKEQGGGLV